MTVNMNKLYKVILLAGMTMVAACGDQLDLEPFDAATTDRALTTQSDFENAVRGMYLRARQLTYYGGWMFSIPDVVSDNVIISSEGRTSKQNYHYFNYTGNDTWLGLWDDGYEAIVAANLILENIDKLPEGDPKNNVQGEALAMRALAHFDMARVFAEIPPFATGEDLGVPYMTSSDPNQLPERPSVSDTYNTIITDLEDAKALIAEDNGEGRLNQAAVAGLLSRVYLYTQDYESVISNASEALEANSTLNDVETFPSLWNDDTDQGVFFKLKILDVDDIAIGNEYSQTGPTGVRSEYVVDYAFYQTYPDNDVRKDVYFSTSEFAGKQFNHIAKYFGRATGNANVNDAKVLRVAEVYLNRAEAYFRSGNEEAALADLNTLRENRYTDFTPGNERGDALLEAILLERRKELAFEGHRFFDLKRLGLPITRSNFGDEASGGGQILPENVMTLPAGSPKFLLPIPQAELNVNPDMEQNPGY